MSEEIELDPAIPNPAQYSASHGRTTRRYRRMRREFRTDCEADDQYRYPHASRNCWLDGKPIDFTLPRGDPMSFNLDHAIPRDVRPDLAEDPANFRASHQLCNQRRGNRAPDLSIGVNSEEW